MFPYRFEGCRRIWALRHGESRANQDGVIVSKPGSLAFTWATLTDLGRQQVDKTASQCPLPPGTLLVTSDFARAHETADIAAGIWGTQPPRIDIRLRERDFGSLEGGSSVLYETVWRSDKVGDCLPADVETPQEVADRTRALVEDLLSEKGWSDLVLVAHGDVLQIAETWMNDLPPSAHRDLPHLQNAELRLLSR